MGLLKNGGISPGFCNLAHKKDTGKITKGSGKCFFVLACVSGLQGCSFHFNFFFTQSPFSYLCLKIIANGMLS